MLPEEEYLLESTAELSPSIAFDDETLMWTGRPSQIINLWNYFCCFSAGIFSGYSIWRWHYDLSQGYEYLTPYVVNTCIGIIIFSILAPIYFYFDIFYEKTTISQNKILEEKGITRLFRYEKYCEISDIRDIKSPSPGVILGLFNLSDLVIETNDDDQPIIVIRAIKNRDKLIHQLLPVWRRLKIERKGFFSDR